MDKDKLTLQILERQEQTLTSIQKNLHKIKKDFKIIEESRNKHNGLLPSTYYPRLSFFLLGVLFTFSFLYLISFLP